ncbi:MAG: acetate--CoA ligase family protein [Proteobacteria bacterium]|nr:acetate--CoA ligase family protein [Pseudomonadota bacterium]MDA1357143.1 acetate--CoA ligase family protein [Pseudomonadota bacterium]
MSALDALLSPRAIAIIGASPDAGKIRGRILAAILAGGYGGPIYPVNPAHAEIQGLRAYASIAAIGQPVDLALIAIPAERVAAALEECADAGIRGAVIFSSGFAESGHAAAQLQAQIGDIAVARGIAVCGPNTAGFLNTGINLNASFSVGTKLDNTPRTGAGSRRRVAIVSQSGGLGFAIYNRGIRRGIAFSHVVGTGNESHLGLLDFTKHLLEKEEVGAIVLLIEQLRGATGFLDVAEKAAALGKPLIVVKFGRSEAARRGALSHTGSLTGGAHAYDAVFRHAGVIRADDQDELLDIAAAFTSCPLPKGRNVGIVTISGGVGVWLADACERQGLSVPELDTDVQTDLRSFIPDYGGVSNPVDITAQALEQGGNVAAIERLYDSPQIDSVIVAASMAEATMIAAEEAQLTRIQARWEKPLMYHSYTMPHGDALAHLSATGIPCYTSVRGNARALQAMADYAAFLELRAADTLPAELQTPALPEGKAVLTEWSAAPYLAALGIAMPAARLVQAADDAVAAAEALKGAVALKAQSPQLTHKSAAGGVALNVEGERHVRRAFEQVSNLPDEIVLDGVLVQKMAPKGVEMIAGIARDETFGPLVMVGFGGTDVEIAGDVAWAPAPFGVARARALIVSLRGFARLSGGAGRRSADIEALVDLLVQLSFFAARNRDRIQELDLNPVVVYEEGEGLMALDALIVTCESRGA